MRVLEGTLEGVLFAVRTVLGRVLLNESYLDDLIIVGSYLFGVVVIAISFMVHDLIFSMNTLLLLLWTCLLMQKS